MATELPRLLPVIDDPNYFAKRSDIANELITSRDRRLAYHMFFATEPTDDYMDDSPVERQRCHEIAAGVIGAESRYAG